MGHSVRLEDIINAESFLRIQESMAEASEMAMLTVDLFGHPVTAHSRCSAFCSLVRSRPELNAQCHRCDSWGGLEAARLRQPFLYRCHMGLVDLAVPIVVGDRYVGAILAGQVLVANPDEVLLLETLPDSRKLLVDPGFIADLEWLRKDLPIVSLGRVRATARMLFQVCAYIVEESMAKMSASASTRLPRFDHPVLKPALEFLDRNLEQPVTLDAMARLCRISPSYFSKVFNREMGESLAAYVNRERVLRARMALVDTERSITTIAFQLGFEDSGYFNKVFKKIVGQTPSEYRLVQASHRRSRADFSQ